jgi:hypothetical protein
MLRRSHEETAVPLDDDLLLTSEAFVPHELARFRQHLAPAWVEESLLATGKASVRRRRLPAEQVVWLVIGMALLRNESIERVVAWLDLAMPVDDGSSVARSAITQARARVGPAPLEHLFAVTSAVWSDARNDAHRWRGLSVYAVDGSTLRVPDSRENWAAFGGQPATTTRGGSAYPTVRMVGLMAARTHVLTELVHADYHTGEATLWKELWNQLPDDSVTLVDRAFLIANDLHRLVASGKNRHWVTRAKTTTRLRVVERLGPNDALVEIQLSDQTRRAHPGLPALWLARAIKYRRKGFRPSTVLTSLLDARAYPASEIVALYHERWEIELGYDEFKTHLLERQESIRSRTPDGVRQEIWGIALAYNLIRVEMARAAAEAGVAPTRISFVAALSIIRHALLMSSTPPLAPGKIPARLLDMRRHIKLLLLPVRRSERRNPRAVKIKMSNYSRKPPTGRGRK